MVLDVDAAEADLAAGALACPRCSGRLRPWSWAPTRRICQLDGAVVALRPRRTRCTTCGSTHLLLPAWCLPRRADAIEVVGTALIAHAAGQGHRRIAAELGRPVSTVRRWLRAVRGDHGRWLYRQGVEHTARLAPERSWPKLRLSPPNSVTCSPHWPPPCSPSAAGSPLRADLGPRRRRHPRTPSHPSTIRMINNAAPRDHYGPDPAAP